MAKGYVSNTKAFDNYSKGWALAISGFWVFLAVVLVQFLLGFVSGTNADGDTALIVGLLAALWSIFIQAPINMSTNWVFLKAARKEKYRFSDMFSVFYRNYWNAVGAGVLVSLIVLVGFILLIVPGIIFAIRLSFTGLLIVDRKLDAIEAIKTSWRMTKGYSWAIFGMVILALLIAIAGFIVLFVGIFFSMMWINSAFAVLFHSVASRSKASRAAKPANV